VALAATAAGRLIAGDSFKQKDAAQAAGRTGSTQSSTASTEPKVIEVNRRGDAPAPIIIRTEPVHITIEAKPNDAYTLDIVTKGLNGQTYAPGLRTGVIRTIQDDYGKAGYMRRIVTAGDQGHTEGF
jgi:hypothetical protein